MYYYLSDYTSERFPRNTKQIEERDVLLKEFGIHPSEDLYDPSTGGCIKCWKSHWKLAEGVLTALALKHKL